MNARVLVVALTVLVRELVVASPVSQHQQQQKQQQQQQHLQVQGYNTPPQYYLQQIQNQPQYISSLPIPQAPTPIYQGAPHHQVTQQFIPQNPPTQRVSQLLLPSAADIQVQRAAEQIAGPEYAQQVQIVQQQGLANEAVVVAQRRAQLQIRRAQQAQQAQQQQQAEQAQLARHQTNQHQQYLTEVSPKQQYVPQQQYQQRQVEQYPSQQQQYEVQYQPTAKPHRAINSQVRANQHYEKEPEEEHDNQASYQFGFDVNDDLHTNYQNRKEERKDGKISGSYSVVDSDGFIRTVTYTADPKEGFKAEVVREPTDIVVKVPKPKEQQHQQYLQTAPASRYQQRQDDEAEQQQQPQHHNHQPQHQKQIVYQYQ